MEEKIAEFINKAIQTAKYAALSSRDDKTLNAMIQDLVAEGEILKKEVADALR